MISGLAVFRPGYGWWPLAVGEKVILSPGEVLHVDITVPYKGPAQDFTLYGSVGNRTSGVIGTIMGFDEILAARAPLSCPESPAAFTPVEGSVDIEIVGAGWFGMGGISPGVDYDLYVKIEEHPSVMDEVDDCIDIVGGAIPDWIGMFMMMIPLMGMAMVVPMVTEGME